MDLSAIGAFVTAAEGGSFTAAASGLGMTASGVSKAVSRLETELNVRLFNRSTRSLSLTADGAALHQRCRQILNDLDDAKLVVLQAQKAPSDRLRVSMPPTFGRTAVIPALAAFMRRYPLVHVEASVTDRIVDLVEGGFDVVIRIGKQPDTRMVARCLGSTAFVVAASPRYLQRHRRPQNPQDLRDHNCLSFISPQTRKLVNWIFSEEDRKHAHPPAGNLSLDNGEAMVDAALSDIGVIYCQDYMIESHLRAGTLERLLEDFTTPRKPIIALYPQNRHLSPKVRAFVDFMVAHFATDGTEHPTRSVLPG